MARGGARNRSGPQPDPESLTSERRGLRFSALDRDGYSGEVPEFPLPPSAFPEMATRELELWEWAWRTPQACAWAEEPWRHHTVAMWVRTAVICEGPGATAADKGSLHRFADQIGMTPAGLRENGWKIEAVVADEGDGEAEIAEDDPRVRFRVVAGGGA